MVKPVDLDSKVFYIPLHKERSPVVQAVAVAARALFTGNLAMVGLVAAGVIAFKFAWPVALGGLALFGLILLIAEIYSYVKNNRGNNDTESEALINGLVKEDSILSGASDEFRFDADFEGIPGDVGDEGIEGFKDDMEDSKKLSPEQNVAREKKLIEDEKKKFFQQAGYAKRKLEKSGALNDSPLRYAILALSLQYDKPVYLTLGLGRACFDGFCQNLGPKLENTDYLEIQAFTLKGEGLLGWLRGLWTGQTIYSEDHEVAIFIQHKADGSKEWIYFDPKGRAFSENLLETNGKSIMGRINTLGLELGDMQEPYLGNGPQDQTDTITCGVHVIRLAEHLLAGNEMKKSLIPRLPSDQIAAKRKEYARNIQERVLDNQSDQLSFNENHFRSEPAESS